MSMTEIWKRFSFARFSLKHVAADGFLLALSLYLSLWMRLGDARLDDHLYTLNKLAAIFIAIRLLTFLAVGVYQSMWRYISTFDVSRLALGILISVPLLMAATYLMPSLGVLPRSLFVIDAFVSMALLLSARMLRRRLFEKQMQPQKGHVSLGKIVIYGAGQNGRLLAQRLQMDPARDRDLLGFVDDDPHKRDRLIHGLPVLGNHEELENLLERSGCTELIVAISEPPPDLMRELLILGRALNVRIQRIAHFDRGTDGGGAGGEALYRQVELKDLLNRPTSEIDLPSVKNLISGKCVLVTGAGGSIGSELARQIAHFSPSKLLLLDHSELALYEIDRELRPATQQFNRVLPLLLDIKDERSLETIFEKHKPQVVFHAAAYKHVHLVEANVGPAVLNNIQGTWNLLKLCERFSAERFVMVSTDKAVNPVGAMGQTKRVCELLTSLMGYRTKRPYSSVRFGNVLGSSGSLIPLLKKQIEDGGPVTVTHPEMTRYFMLIPEAVALILMSATLSEPGDINVLKMGEPMKILDLAKSLMALMGKRDGEVSIAFTGARPGEKMYEELYLTGSELATRHTDILTVPRGEVELSFVSRVEHLVSLARSSDPVLVIELRQLANPDGNFSGLATAASETLV